MALAQGGGPVSEIVASARASARYDAAAFGNCVWDGAHDVEPCVASAVAAAGSGGNATVSIPAGVLPFHSMLTVTAPNITIQCAGWDSVIQRHSSLTGATQIVYMTGAGDVIRDCTIDGHDVVNTSADLQVSGANSLIDHVQAINGAGTIQVAISGQNSTLTRSRIIGTSPDANIYGVWAGSGSSVTIDHNTVSNTGIDGIGANGKGTRIVANHVFNSHCYTGMGGGQIVAYPGNPFTIGAISWSDRKVTITTAQPHGIPVGATIAVSGMSPSGYNGDYTAVAGTTGNTIVYRLADDPGGETALGFVIDANANDGILVANNTVDRGCNSASGAFEIAANNILVTGNTAVNQQWNGAGTDPGTTGVAFIANTIKNSCQTNTSPPCAAFVSSSGGVTNLTLVNNIFIDDQMVPTQQRGIYILGAADNLNIQGNNLTGNVIAPLVDNSTGVNKIIKNNLGVDNVIPSVASASTLTLPLNPTVSLTGTTTVTKISAAAWTGREIKLIPNDVVSFTATNNIANAITTSAKVPIIIVYDGTSWNLSPRVSPQSR